MEACGSDFEAAGRWERLPEVSGNKRESIESFLAQVMLGSRPQARETSTPVFYSAKLCDYVKKRLQPAVPRR